MNKYNTQVYQNGQREVSPAGTPPENSPRKKEGCEGSDVAHLETRKSIGEENEQEHKLIELDTHEDIKKALKLLKEEFKFLDGNPIMYDSDYILKTINKIFGDLADEQ